ncbi:unnamed protein product [Onchocerca ochengi]|uniref:Uncharacterized protein n=1 Tax=Onchocerca ochengi TaxID=42157 RepID=A0A182ERE1_ONCOC|nr:unnamed protein product [Onchocerca ochengi]
MFFAKLVNDGHILNENFEGVQLFSNDHIWDRISNEIIDDNVIISNENTDENERLKNYENDLRKRRELDEHRAKENAFLRESLRGSRKLLSLENHKSNEKMESPGHKNGTLANSTITETGYANNAYVASDTFCGNIDIDKNEAIPLEQVMISMNRVAEHLEKQEGRKEESKLLRDFFMQKPVQQAIENNIIINKNNKVSF